jgi:TetR/AcrR family acrAB operon transcriptional repressor
MDIAYNLKRLQGAKTRAELLAAGIKVFAERGYHRARLDDIAAAAGTTKGALYWHFADKEDFLAAMLEKLIERWNKQEAERIPMQGDALDFLLSSLARFAERLLRIPWLERLISTVSLDAETISPRIVKLVRKAREPNRCLAARIIRYGQETGVFRRDLDADKTGTAIAALRTGLAISWYIDPDPFELWRATAASVEAFVPGLLSKQAASRKVVMRRPNQKRMEERVEEIVRNLGLSPSEILSEAARERPKLSQTHGATVQRKVKVARSAAHKRLNQIGSERK